jgi:N-acyl homoserine lactone hydrolase
MSNIHRKKAKAMRLYLFQLAIHPASGIPAPGYLIQTDDGDNILIDTGFPRRHESPEMGLHLHEHDYIVDQLAALGLAPHDIDYLICTHFDPDHAGGHDAFPDAELIVQRQHYEVARAGAHSRFEQMRSHWDHPSLRYRLIDGDTALLPGVELIETSGHVPGHQSVLVRLPQTGLVLLAIDAVMRAAQFDPETREIGPQDMDEADVRASTGKLVELGLREGVALVVFGHDAEQWRTLKKAPDYYC